MRRLSVFLFLVVSVFLLLNFLPANSSLEIKADRILIEKSARRLSLLKQDRLLRSYKISLGRNPVGKKEFEGDNKTPEGDYVVDFHKPDSAFYKALHISYPNAEDMTYAAKHNKNAGGQIMIHGMPNKMGWVKRLHRFVDWTKGCIAVTNAEMDEIYYAVDDGTPVKITP